MSCDSQDLRTACRDCDNSELTFALTYYLIMPINYLTEGFVVMMDEVCFLSGCLGRSKELFEISSLKTLQM